MHPDNILRRFTPGYRQIKRHNSDVDRISGQCQSARKRGIRFSLDKSPRVENDAHSHRYLRLEGYPVVVHFNGNSPA
ncbi:hypothetical protein D3C76_1414500 [compost metagenome]